MHRNSWKAGERRIAALFGSRRTPLSGRNSGHGTGSDCLHPRLYVEVKHRKRVPSAALWREVKECAGKEGKIPLIVLIEKGSPYPLVLCALSHLQAIAKEMVSDTCSACGGSRAVVNWQDIPIECPRCNGTGRSALPAVEVKP